MNEPVPIDCGWHIKMRDDGEACIDVLQMLYNYRIVLSSPNHMTHEHGWCYFGHGGKTMEDARLAAFAAAMVWDGYGSPPGFDKQAL